MTDPDISDTSLPASSGSAVNPPGKPELALNKGGGETVANAINGFLRYAAVGLTGPTHLDIASAYFDAEGYAQISETLGRIDSVRLLLGAEPHPPAPRPRPLGDGFRPSGTSEQQKLEQASRELDENIRWGRDMLGFTPETASHVAHLLRWLESGRVQVRKLRSQFLHGKAFLIGTDGHGVIAGSSNFTRAGLTSNVELNLGNYSPHIVGQVQEFFNDLWHKAEEYDLAAIFSQEFKPHQPYLIYLKMLHERYGDELQSEEVKSTDFSLTEFQEHGVERARRILSKYNGVLIADEVGLGKTYIAAAIIGEAVKELRQRVLIVAPAALRDGMWDGFLHNSDFGRKSVILASYEDLTMGKFKDELDEFALVVVDEAHYLRNPSTQRAEVFHRLLDCYPRKKLVLLTATPINNSLDDLQNLLGYFLRYDTDLADAGVRSLKEKFKEAQSRSPEELTPKDLFDVIDAVAVRRMRQFIKKHYPDSRIPGDAGGQIVQFPETSVEPVPYELDDVLPSGFFEEFKNALSPDGLASEGSSPDGLSPDALSPDGEASDADPKVLTLARYTPSVYLKAGSPAWEESVELYENRLAGLMRSLLLKRFESSPHAFANSCQQMIDKNDAFVELLQRGIVANKKLLTEYIATDTDALTEDELAEEFIEEIEHDAANYDVDQLLADVENDTALLRQFAEKARQVTRRDDPTLKALTEALEEILKDAASGGKDEQDARNRRKVLIFTYYSDTVDWIFEHLQDETAKPASPLADYRERIAKITGSHGAGDKSDVLLGFAPLTAGTGKDEDKYDIVVTTDVLAEGVNLQQARHIINYDLPWNPMRLVQRHGRIDRIGSLHEEVQMRCVFPDSKLDEILGLETKLRTKLKQAATVVGAPQVLPFQNREELNFADTQAEIEHTREGLERIKAGDPTFLETAGKAVAALSGEEFRQELRQALDDETLREQIEHLPWRSGSGMAISMSGAAGSAAADSGALGNGVTGFGTASSGMETSGVEVPGAKSLSSGISGMANSGMAIPGTRPGYVFCIRIGDQPIPQFRFVEADEQGVNVRYSDTLECLFLSKPPNGKSTPPLPENSPALPQDLGENHIVYEAWEAACQDVLESWNRASDKAEVEPKIERVLSDCADLLNQHPPTGQDQATLQNAIDSIKAPLSPRHTRQFRKLYKEHKDTPKECAQQILEEITRLGLKPYKPPSPNPEIKESDIHLICWLAIQNK